MMDRDSTGGTGGDKPKWRERLGTGAKDMPKISDEFKSQPFVMAATPDGRPPQPVTKLAPMAPRSPGAQAPPDAPAMKEPRPSPAPEGQSSDGLAEKLRAQRAAAEMLAVQRVSAARQRAEARIATEPTPPPPAAQRALFNEVGSKSEAAKKTASPPPPKFTFADESQSVKRQEPAATSEKGNGVQRGPGSSSLAALTPPRPALGGERPQSSLLRPLASPYRPEPTSPFRPIDPATGYTPPSSRLPPLGGQRPYLQEPGSLSQGSREIARKPNEPYRRAESPTYGAELRGEDWSGEPRFGRPPVGRGAHTRAPEDDLDDVFEDEAPPRRRAGASDYRSAYREAEEGDTDDRRRSNGPWLLLLALLVAAFATGGVILLYKSKSTVSTASNTSDSVPIVAAPEQPAKTAAEKPANGADSVAAANRKQIYDRIVGDREVTGETVVPTEVTPVQPETVEPDSGIPQLSGSGDQGQGTEDAVPLALPPASGQDTQGKLEQPKDELVVAAGAQSGVEEVKPQTATQNAATTASFLPATGAEEATPGVEGKPASANNTVGPSAAMPANTSASTGAIKPEVQSSPPIQKKIATAKKKKPAAETTASLSEPLVIVPPVEIAAPSQQAVQSGAVSPADTVAKPPTARRKRTLFDIFNRKSDSPAGAATVQQAAPLEPAPPQPEKPAETKVASLQPVPEKPSAASGYVVQLASFRSPEEAQAEYARLQSKYPSVIGSLPSSITQATVGGSTRHRLGLGPVATRDQASQVCNSLIAAGERDCLVRKQ